MMHLFRKSARTDGWRSVHFDASQVRACHVRRRAGARPLVTMAAATALDGDSPGEALLRLARDWHGQPHAYTTALDMESYQFLPVEAPNVPADELRAAISWTVTDMIDFRKEDATIDVLSIPYPRDFPQRPRLMYAVVTRTELANEMHRRFQAARLPLGAIDVPEMAQRNIAALAEPQGRAIALVSFSPHGSLLTLSCGGELYLARRIKVSLQQLLDDDSARRSACQEQVALEIQRSLDHFGRQFAWLGVAGLLVAPLGADDRGLLALLAENLEVAPEALRLDALLDLSQAPALLDPAMQRDYFIALGLALRHEEKAL